MEESGDKSLRILVVDDSPSVRAVLCMCLRISKMPILQIHEASHGEEALGLLKRFSMDLVFTDLNMPVMNGKELISWIRQDLACRAIPVVVVSYEDSGQFQERHGDLRANAVMRKPFTPQGIAKVMGQVMPTVNNTTASA